MNFWKDAWTVDLILTHAGNIDLIFVKYKKLVVWLDIKLDTIRLRNHFVAEFIFFAPFLKTMSPMISNVTNYRRNEDFDPDLDNTYPIIGKKIYLIEISMITAYWRYSIYSSQWAASISIICTFYKGNNNCKCPNQTHCWSEK